MSKTLPQVKMQVGTLIRHNVIGYAGRIDGTTEIKTCFTEAGKLLENPSMGHLFQYRVVVEGESIRRIAPPEDLEILEGCVEIVCSRCNSSFNSKPGLEAKPGGRCKCGAWICPFCLACRSTGMEAAKDEQPSCLKERKRLVSKLAVQKRRKGG